MSVKSSAVNFYGRLENSVWPKHAADAKQDQRQQFGPLGAALKSCASTARAPYCSNIYRIEGGFFSNFWNDGFKLINPFAALWSRTLNPKVDR
jgi:hypothetical protein